MTTLLASPLLQRSALPDLENLFGDATIDAPQTVQATTKSSQWSVPTRANGMSKTHVEQTSVATPQPTNTDPDDESISAQYKSLPKDAKIGIIACIVVIVSLSLLSCGMCFLKFKRRKEKKRARRERREAEAMMEMEMRNAQPKPQTRVQKGLWDHLKPKREDGDFDTALMAEAEARHDAMDRNQLDRRNDSIVDSARSGSVVLYSQVAPRDRTSIGFPAPSVISSTGAIPIVPQSILDGGTRR